MNRTTLMKHAKRLALGLAALALAATPSFAQRSYDLCATTGTVTMPDATVVPIWGYVAGNCTTGSGTATLPGPMLRATAGETLTINLYTDLSVPVSFFAPGLLADPVTSTGAAGMFTVEATAAASASYQFPNIKAGSYLYHSGTDMRTQVPMGLYGALVVDVAEGQAYGDVTYAQDEVLVFSEIDPDLNADPTKYGGARVFGTRDIYGRPLPQWSPRYFLINGKAYPDTADIAAPTGQDTLLRFVNAGLQTFVPTLDGGLYMDLVAEDGNRYPQPFTQYGIELTAGKTIDAIVRPGAGGSYPLYDRALHLTNGLNTGGGLLTYLQAGPAADAPTAANDPAAAGDYTIAEGGSLTTIAGGSPAGVLDNDTFLAPATGLTAVLVVTTPNGTLECVGGDDPAICSDGSFTYTPNADFSGTDVFTYIANDGTYDSNVATATITVTPVDDPPVANDDSATTPPDVAVVIDVVANDTDPDGNLDPTTANTDCTGGSTGCSAPSFATAFVNNLDGTFSYTGPAGTDTFVYEVCDTTALCDTATVTIDVANNPPVANPDAATTPLNTAVTVDVVANDTDVDGNLDPTTVAVTSGPTSGTIAAVDTVTGAITYTPNTNFDGTDSFVYEVCDNEPLCDTATVTITVVNAAPIANDDFASTVKNSAGVVIFVTANDTDDGAIDVTTVVITSGGTTPRGGSVVENNDGTVTYVPKRGFRGTDTFQYTVNDNAGVTSNVATVRVNVL